MFSIFNNEQPASWVGHMARDFLTCSTKKNILVFKNAGDEKILHPVGCKFFFSRFSGDVLFSSLVSFAFFVFLFFCLYTYIFTRPISGNKTTFFGFIPACIIVPWQNCTVTAVRQSWQPLED